MKTVSLELAKQLKEAGYSEESYFKWINMDDEWELVPENNIFKPHLSLHHYYISAPTADEILDKLPAFTNLPYFLYIWKDDAGLYRIVYCSSADLSFGGKKPNYPVEKQNSLADAAALMYLYLKKEKLL